MTGVTISGPLDQVVGLFALWALAYVAIGMFFGWALATTRRRP